jgi:hypothetical protein
MVLSKPCFSETWVSDHRVVRSPIETDLYRKDGVIAILDTASGAKLVAAAPQMLRELVRLWCDYGEHEAPAHLTQLLMMAGVTSDDLEQMDRDKGSTDRCVCGHSRLAHRESGTHKCEGNGFTRTYCQCAGFQIKSE